MNDGKESLPNEQDVFVNLDDCVQNMKITGYYACCCIMPDII